MLLNEFKSLFFTEVKNLLGPIHAGHELMLQAGHDEDDYEADYDVFDILAVDLEFVAMRALLQDGKLTEHELDLFIDICDFLNLSGNRIQYERDVRRAVMENTLDRWRADGVLEIPMQPITLIYIKIYDSIHGTHHRDQVRHLFLSFLLLCMKSDGQISSKEQDFIRCFKELIWEEMDAEENSGFQSPQIINPVTEASDSTNNIISVDDLITQLGNMTGIESVKDEVKRLVNAIKVNKMRIEKGLQATSNTNHLVFYGNPGTGKTTVARLLAGIFKGLGVLKSGHLIEVDRSSLVAGYVGQTSIKTREVIQSALGGVLFIDEAYTLSKEGNDYGSEAIDTLLKMMEDHRLELIVIVAGYTEKMTTFLNFNPGLKSRFTRFMNFPDYAPQELAEILDTMASATGMQLTTEAKSKAMDLFKIGFSDRGESFGNARLVRNLFHDAISLQADRIVDLTELNEGILQTLIADDIPDSLISL